MIRLVSLLGILAIINAHAKSSSRKDPKSVALTVRCLGVSLWPVVIVSICPHCPHIFAGTVWMFAMEVMNAFVLMDPTSSKGIRVEKSAFLGVAFALAAMSGNHPQSINSKLFLYTILGMFLTVFPHHDLDNDSLHSIVLENVQQVILHYCIAVFVTAISLTRSNMSPAQTVPATL